MIRIIDKRGTGKTNRLMLLAKENNGILVCSNPNAMRKKAEAYGLTGFDIISYQDYVLRGTKWEKPCFIDEAENFICSFSQNLNGYTLSNED